MRPEYSLIFVVVHLFTCAYIVWVISPPPPRIFLILTLSKDIAEKEKCRPILLMNINVKILPQILTN
jgi:hypothetical protein